MDSETRAEPRRGATAARPAGSRDRELHAPLGAALQRTLGNRVVCRRLSWPIQAKFVVGAPADRFEQEADDLARRATHAHAGPPVTVQRWSGGGESSVEPGVERAIAGARGRGRPLSEPERGPVERTLGVDLRAVRVHEDGDADRLTRRLTARAFTTGPDIFVRPGEYPRGSAAGQELIAHELVHVAQQGAVPSRQSPYALHAAPARVVQRVLSEVEQQEKATLEKRKTELTAIIESKGMGQLHQKNVNAAKLERGAIQIRLSKLLAREAELSPEDKKRQADDALAAEQQRRAEEAKREALRVQAVATNQAALAAQIQGTLAASDAAKQALATALGEIKDVKEHTMLEHAAEVSVPLDLLRTAVLTTNVARGKAGAVDETTSVDDANAFLKAATDAATAAAAEQVKVHTGIAAVAVRMDLAAQNDRFAAENSIRAGYTGTVALTLDHTFVSNDDAKVGGFSGEYQLAGKGWCVHVHRSKAGRWQKAHVKNQGDYTVGNSVDLPVAGDGNVRPALVRLGILENDTNAGSFFKENKGPYHNGNKAQPALNTYLK